MSMQVCEFIFKEYMCVGVHIYECASTCLVYAYMHMYRSMYGSQNVTSNVILQKLFKRSHSWIIYLSVMSFMKKMTLDDIHLAIPLRHSITIIPFPTSSFFNFCNWLSFINIGYTLVEHENCWRKWNFPS